MNRQYVAVVIDDEPRISDLVRMLLHNIGFQVHVAADGEAGLALVRQKRPDLLVTDMLLPKLHGLEVCKAVRADASLGHVRIIAMTAIYKRMKFRLDMGEADVDAFLEKPFDINGLQHIVKNMFPDLRPEPVSVQPAEDIDALMNEAVRRISMYWNQFVDNPAPGPVLESLQEAVLGLDELAVRGENLSLTHACSELKRMIQEIQSTGGGLLQTTEDAFSQVLKDIRERVGMADSPPSKPAPSSTAVKAEDVSKQERPRSRVPGGIPLWWIAPSPQKVRRYVSQFSSLGFQLHIADLSAGTPNPEGAVAVMVDLRATSDLRSLRIQTSEWRFRLGDSVPIIVMIPSETAGPDALMKIMEAGASYVLTPPLEVWAVVQKLLPKTSFRHRIQGRILVLDSTSRTAPARVIPDKLGYTVRVVDEVDELAALVAAYDPELILIGERFGALAGVKLLRFVRETVPGIPVLAVVNQALDDTVDPLVREGVNGVLSPQVSAAIMAAAIDTELRRSRRLRRQAGRMPESGLLAPGAFLSSVADVIQQSRDGAGKVWLCVWSFVDREKWILSCGPSFLARVMQCVDYMARMWSGTAFCGTWTGEDVVIALPGFDEPQAREWMTSFVSDFHQLTFVSGHEEHRVGIRWGLSEVREATSVPDALAAARKKSLENPE